MTIYLHAKNNNWAIRERKRIIVDLRQATISFDEKRYPYAVQYIIANGQLISITHQPIKSRRSKKYHALHPKGAFFVPRPPTRTSET